MTEQFILQFAPLRLKQQGYNKYHFRHGDFIVEAGNTVTIPAYNEMFFIIDEPPGLVVDSDYGMYDSTDDPIPECIHIHRGEIKITKRNRRNRQAHEGRWSHLQADCRAGKGSSRYRP